MLMYESVFFFVARILLKIWTLNRQIYQNGGNKIRKAKSNFVLAHKYFGPSQHLPCFSKLQHLETFLKTAEIIPENKHSVIQRWS